MKQLLMISAELFLATLSYSQGQSQTHFDGKTWWDYVKALADDNMDGREAGSEGLRKAEAYNVVQLKLNQPVNIPAAALYEEVIHGLMISVANNDRRLDWAPDSFFRRYADAAGE